MFSIGEFARHGRISVRMLRHYDSIGLLHPAHVDPASGYRFYAAGQLSDLNRIVALKDLGFTLEQVRTILAEHVTAAELRGMLRLRRAEIQAQIGAETTRLARVEARLLSIEDESRAPVDGVVLKRLPPGRVAELTGIAASYQPEDITPVIQPLYRDLWTRLAAAGHATAGRGIAAQRFAGHATAGRDIAGQGIAGRGIAYYEDSGSRADAVVVHAAVQVADEPGEAHGITVVDLPEVASAATIIHHGPMDDIMPTGQALARWIDANGYRSAGYPRELMVEWSPDPEQWVTELQQPVRPAHAGTAESTEEDQ